MSEAGLVLLDVDRGIVPREPATGRDRGADALGLLHQLGVAHLAEPLAEHRAPVTDETGVRRVVAAELAQVVTEGVTGREQRAVHREAAVDAASG